MPLLSCVRGFEEFCRLLQWIAPDEIRNWIQKF
jgi:hypothetical protein